MIQVGLLLTKEFRLLSLAAILDVFDTVNKSYLANEECAPFQLLLLHRDGDTHAGSNSFFTYRSLAISEAETLNLILIPAFNTDNMEHTIAENSTFLPWLNEQYQNGAEIASFCTGAFLLGASGLLNGKIATTHVDACNGFAAAFPEVQLRSDKTLTEDKRIYTSGGATSTFHLLLHLINRYCGKETSVRTAKVFAIDMDRDKQSYFSTFQPSKNHNDELVAKTQQKIEKHYKDSGTLEAIIKDIPSSRRNIARRFKQVTGITPIEYLQQTRIEAAKKLLEQTSQQMTEIVFNSGYCDPKSFRKIFRKTVGMTPTEYRDKFQVSL